MSLMTWWEHPGTNAEGMRAAKCWLFKFYIKFEVLVIILYIGISIGDLQCQ